MPTIKPKAHPLNPAQAKARFWKPTTLVGWFWSALVGLITLAGGWTIVRPVVHVDPYIRLDPDSPFSERFKVSNDGFFPVYDLDVSCRIIKAVTKRGGWLSGVTLINYGGYRKVLNAADSATINCPVSNVIQFPNDKFASAEIELSLVFTPSWYFWHKEKTVKFIGQLDSQGNVQWAY